MDVGKERKHSYLFSNYRQLPLSWQCLTVNGTKMSQLHDMVSFLDRKMRYLISLFLADEV